MKITVGQLKQLIKETMAPKHPTMPNTRAARLSAIEQLSAGYPDLAPAFERLQWGDGILLDPKKFGSSFSQLIDVLRTDPIAQAVWSLTDLGDGTFALNTHALDAYHAEEERLFPLKENMETMGFVAVELANSTKVEAATAAALVKKLLRISRDYPPDERRELVNDVRAWDGTSLLDTGTSGSSGQSGDTWIVGPRGLVEQRLAVEGMDLENDFFVDD